MIGNKEESRRKEGEKWVEGMNITEETRDQKNKRVYRASAGRGCRRSRRNLGTWQHFGDPGSSRDHGPVIT